MLTAEEHSSEALDCLEISRRLIANGTLRPASDILWLAVKHSISTIGIATGEDHGKYQHKRAIVRRLAAEHDEEQLGDALNVAMKIHADADQGFLTVAELTSWQQRTYAFVDRLLNIATQLTTTQRQTN
ncbi:MAG: hypothetical protein OXE87_05860 [Chloroflexi bacterium]|nr:hypothetical protein [Chloroflexota bacterium]